jgi:outer membrane protein
MPQPFWQPNVMRIPTRAASLFVFLLYASSLLAQVAPATADRPWNSPREQGIEDYAEQFRGYPFAVDPTKTYSLPDLIDLGEAHNPQTRLAWERARAQAAALGVAHSELYPTIAAALIPQVDRVNVLFDTQYYL